jgi:ring-1,2-phenylacetyl-CoA epoxidase subunit PaaC
MSYSNGQLKAIKELLFKIADDELIIGHRNSEWTGLGPILEEDIAFSSIAQDKIGQSLQLYKILNELGEAAPDVTAFMRDAGELKCCHLVEYPIGEYDFSLMRNFLFNHAEHIRFEMLANSSFEPLANLAKKIKGETKYHIMHADTWIKQLGNAAGESRTRLQNTLDEIFNSALGIFEPGDFEDELRESKVFEGEKTLENKWMETIIPVLKNASLEAPLPENRKPSYGGRKGIHTKYLQPMVDEMAEVFRIDPKAEW